ncbi:FbpB family small basic protein [Halobacillus litoralis]|uniref:FbpB family small basic protein n=1 Tax=Halobacillus litoralis TaxID=45668 RepID=A0A410MJB7_9BACI|nr:FbpB family small basic protein [Halobacillus litoralis]QAS54755.1 FbpB family small basic protein [Halobacillus litoralis]
MRKKLTFNYLISEEKLRLKNDDDFLLAMEKRIEERHAKKLKAQGDVTNEI